MSLSVYGRYVRFHSRFPSLTAAVTGTVVMSAGDAVAQLFIEERPSLDARRNGVCAAYNGIMSPMVQAWYSLLDRKLPGPVGSAAFATKLIVNQLVSSSVLNAGFFAWSATMENALRGSTDARVPWRDLHADTADRAKRDLPALVTKSFFTWLPFNAVNFLFVPAHFRILFVSTVACGWGAYLSFVSHRHHDNGGESNFGDSSLKKTAPLAIVSPRFDNVAAK